MRHRRIFNHHDTSEKPSIEMWLDRDDVVPVLPADNDQWTKTNWTIDANGYLDAAAVVQFSYIERHIPELVEGHRYEVTVTIGAGDVLTVTLGDQTLATGISNGTFTYQVIPTGGNKLRFEWVGAAAGTVSVTAVAVRALNPLELDLIPVIAPFTS